jgi:hypothetical protein
MKITDISDIVENCGFGVFADTVKYIGDYVTQGVQELKKVNFGTTGLQVPAIVLGCMRLNKLDLAGAVKHIENAVAQDVNFFDHADIYGRGACEELFGKALKMTDIAYGIWAGTSVNDTASVVASGYAFSEMAGDFATMVKLTRTIAIIPTVLVFAFISTRIKQKEMKVANNGKNVNLVKIIPWFIGGFLLLAILNSIGLIPATLSSVIKGISKFLMVTALAAIGLSTSITDFKKAGLRPMFYGITIDTLVTLTALVVIWCMGLM